MCGVEAEVEVGEARRRRRRVEETEREKERALACKITGQRSDAGQLHGATSDDNRGGRSRVGCGVWSWWVAGVVAQVIWAVTSFCWQLGNSCLYLELQCG